MGSPLIQFHFHSSWWNLFVIPSRDSVFRTTASSQTFYFGLESQSILISALPVKITNEPVFILFLHCILLAVPTAWFAIYKGRVSYLIPKSPHQFPSLAFSSFPPYICSMPSLVKSDLLVHLIFFFPFPHQNLVCCYSNQQGLYNLQYNLPHQIISRLLMPPLTKRTQSPLLYFLLL